jgi:hypothetical protein
MNSYVLLREALSSAPQVLGKPVLRQFEKVGTTEKSAHHLPTLEDTKVPVDRNLLRL